MREFCDRQIRGPGFRVLRAVDTKICLNFLIHAFGGTVRLRVVSSAKPLFDP